MHFHFVCSSSDCEYTEDAELARYCPWCGQDLVAHRSANEPPVDPAPEALERSSELCDSKGARS